MRDDVMTCSLVALDDRGMPEFEPIHPPCGSVGLRGTALGGTSVPTFTMRMPEKDYEALQAMALLTGKTMAELVREAIVEKVARFAESDDADRQIEDEAARRKHALSVIRESVAS